MKIAELPFRERPVMELLAFAPDREDVQHDYAGFGWARVPRIWLVGKTSPPVAVDDALVLALHTPDDAPETPGDLRLELELPDGPVGVMLSKFLEVWLPELPATAAIVLCVCNPHDTLLALSVPRPTHVPLGDVESYYDRDADRIELEARAWSRLGVP